MNVEAGYSGSGQVKLSVPLIGQLLHLKIVQMFSSRWTKRIELDFLIVTLYPHYRTSLFMAN